MSFTTLNRPTASKLKTSNGKKRKSSSLITSRLYGGQSPFSTASKQRHAVVQEKAQLETASKKKRVMNVVSDDNFEIIISKSYSASKLQSRCNAECNEYTPVQCECPSDYLESIISCNSKHRVPQELDNFFIEQSYDESGYDFEVIAAIRNQDIATLRAIHRSGRSLQCANRFGESLLHMACRRGFDEVVDFLIHEAGVSVRIRDDYGRTPLHDACWTATPNFKLVEMLILESPELLWIRDKRNDAPLHYARREHWQEWNNFIRAQKQRIGSTSSMLKK